MKHSKAKGQVTLLCWWNSSLKICNFSYSHDFQYKQSLHDAEHADLNNPFDEPIVPDANNPFFDEAATSSKPGTPKSSAAVDLEPNLTPFSGLISQSFEPYLDIYIETQNQNLSELVERAAQVQQTV